MNADEIRYLFKYDGEIPHLDRFFDEFDCKNHRATAVLGGALLEKLLYNLLKSFMVADAEKVEDLVGQRGRVSGASIRAELAYSLGLVSKGCLHDLKLIQDVRNKFAHEWEKTSFDDEPIRGNCSSLTIVHKVKRSVQSRSIAMTARDRYILAVTLLARSLDQTRKGIESGSDPVRRKCVVPEGPFIKLAKAS